MSIRLPSESTDSLYITSRRPKTEVYKSRERSSDAQLRLTWRKRLTSAVFAPGISGMVLTVGPSG